jgi:hypothetical protein
MLTFPYSANGLAMPERFPDPMDSTTRACASDPEGDIDRIKHSRNDDPP